MSTGMERIREQMTRYLQDHGVNAAEAWPRAERLEQDAAVVSVSLRRCQAGPAGFRDYLGERFNQENGRWEELYGKRVKLTFGLDLYAEAQVGEQGIQAAFDTLAEAFQAGGPEGLELQELSCGETVYEDAGRLLKRPAQAVCTAYLYAVSEPGGGFLDFEIRGGIKQ